MSGLFGGGKNVAQEEQRLAGIQLQTSAYGMAVAIIWGKNRVAPNLIWLNDFVAIPHTTTTKTGKNGGGGSTNTQTTYTYQAATIFALGEGSAIGIGKWWRDKDIHEAGDTGGFTFISGQPSQSPWGYLSSKHPSEAVGYGGTILLCHPTNDLGASGTLKNHSFEVITGYSVPGYDDGDASDFAEAFLTDSRWGCGFPASKLDAASLASYSQYVRAALLLISPVIEEQKPARDHLSDVLKATNTAAVWSQRKLKFIPYADQPVSSPLGSFTPNTTPIYSLTDDDFLADNDEDPIQVMRTNPSDAHNRFTVEHRNRGNDYNVETSSWSSLADVELYGLRAADPVKLEMITMPRVGELVAQLLGQREIAVRLRFKFKLGARFALLDAMDLLNLTHSKMGISSRTVRVSEVEIDEDWNVSVTAEDWPLGTASAPLYSPPGGTGGGGPNENADPGNANAPVLYEPPSDLCGATPQVWLGSSGGAEWGGAEVWASRDGTSYSLVGTIVNPAKHGSLLAALPDLGTATVVDGVDTTSIASVDLTVSAGTLLSATQPDADHYETLCLVGDEVLAYRTAGLASANQYDLTMLRRGLHGSTTTAKAPGASFMRLDEAVCRVDIDRWNEGETILFKLCSFNRFGRNRQDLADVTPFSYTIQGNAQYWPAPTSVTLNITSTRPA